MDISKVKKNLRQAKENHRLKRKKPKNKCETVRNMNLDELDKFGEGMWSYSPTKKTRGNLLKILSRTVKNKQKKALVKKIGEEFEVIYSEYRNLAYKALNVNSSFVLNEAYRKKFQIAAEYCLKKNITPKQLLKFWSVEISNFVPNMKTLTVPFITSVINIDTASIAKLEEKHNENAPLGEVNSVKPRNKMDAKEKLQDWVASRNSYADLRKLDERLRPALKKAKFKGIDQVSDIDLLSAQILCRDLSKGYSIFVDEERRELVNWILKKFYKGVRKI